MKKIWVAGKRIGGMVVEAGLNVVALGCAGAACVYLFPAWVAVNAPGGHRVTRGNIYWGWTGVGWLAMLLWAGWLVRPRATRGLPQPGAVAPAERQPGS